MVAFRGHQQKPARQLCRSSALYQGEQGSRGLATTASVFTTRMPCCGADTQCQTNLETSIAVGLQLTGVPSAHVTPYYLPVVDLGRPPYRSSNTGTSETPLAGLEKRRSSDPRMTGIVVVRVKRRPSGLSCSSWLRMVQVRRRKWQPLVFELGSCFVGIPVFH